MTTELLVQTRLIPPRPRRQWLSRPRLSALLERMIDVPLTLVIAGTGYGKSTTLAGFFAARRWTLGWYSLGDEDRDPVRFLRHVIGALRLCAPGIGEQVLNSLSSGWSPALGERAIDMLCNELLDVLPHDTFLVLDDYQHIDSAPPIGALVERLLAHAPPQLHLVLASRRRPPLAGLAAWRARGLLRQIERHDLAFPADEVQTLFAAQGRSISAAEAEMLTARTEGWAVALQLLQQGIGGESSASARLLERASPSLQALFDYLAEEVLNVQPPEVQRFLLHTAILRVLHPALCDALLHRDDSSAFLRKLHGEELFLLSIGQEHYRYHQLFQDFLQEQAQRQAVPLTDLHRLAAAWYRRQGQDEEALYHELAAGETTIAAQHLALIAESWNRSGRAATLKSWLDRLPPALLASSPELLYAQGEALRLLSHFDEALTWYRRTEAAYAQRRDALGQSQALRGQAQVYLDTVRPAPAETLLKRALKLLGRDHRVESAALLHLLAENMTNRGRAGLAAKLLAAAERMHPDTATTTISAARVELRTGQIAAARRRLQAELDRLLQPAAADHAPEAHREPLLLLSLLECWLGDPEAARSHAEAGLQRGQTLGSPIVEAVGQIRLGHSLHLLGDDESATACYERALQLADLFGVARTKAEPLMGLVLLAGIHGNLSGAEAYAREALAIVERTGDEWMAALLWTALAIAEITAGHQSAEHALTEAEIRFSASSDTYGVAAIQLWRAIALLRAGDIAHAADVVRALLQQIETYHYECLLTRPTLFTPCDRQMIPPLLLLGSEIPEVAPIARQLLTRAFPGLNIVAEGPAATTSLYHPGATLRIQLLGRFRAWRGNEEIASWSREKARQLLQLLITERGRWLQRDQIIDLLWPDAGLSTAEGQFKVALNALTTTLEPQRPPHAPSFYIKRNGTAYRFAPPADAVEIDVEQFAALLDQAETTSDPQQQVALYRRALALYGGDYLPESLYQDWVTEPRERLQRRYLAAATRLAALVLDHESQEAIRWCEAVLAIDPCWEEAYRLLMQAYLRQGNRSQALRIYERCVRQLDAELGIQPLPATTAIYESIRERGTEDVSAGL
ncbi:MAG TPA: BTAD domain-containing putative transcriptional regulator [Herpetosiphonaceae bacterium]